MDAPSRPERLRLLVDTTESGDLRAPDSSFEAVQLHDRSPFCWAVIGRPSGAIALGASGELLMRRRQHEAERFAVELTESAARAITEH